MSQTQNALARIEERESLREFGDEYRAYMARVPGFIPHWGSRGGQARAQTAAEPSRSRRIGHSGR
jgi:hypothetical protein